MVNPLVDVIPPKARRYLYAAYALAALIIGAMNAGGMTIGRADDVLAYLAIPFGALAASNVSEPPAVTSQDEEATE
jgi:hypothetical protein